MLAALAQYSISGRVTLRCPTQPPYPLTTGTINHQPEALGVRRGGCESLLYTRHYYSYRWHIQGVQKKMSRSFCLISLATNMQESWDIIHWKGGIHSFVWSTKTFLYDIREPRYMQIRMGYQISKCLNIGKSSALKSDSATIYA